MCIRDRSLTVRYTNAKHPQQIYSCKTYNAFGKNHCTCLLYTSQSGEKLFCEYDQQVKHYPEKRGIVHNEILLPPNAPQEYACLLYTSPRISNGRN